MKIRPRGFSRFHGFATVAVLLVCTAGVASAASGVKRVYDGTPRHCQADVPSSWVSAPGFATYSPDRSARISLSTGLLDSMAKNRNYLLLGVDKADVIENDAKRTIVATAPPKTRTTRWDVLAGAGSVSCEAIIFFKRPVTAVIKQIAESVKPVH